MVGKVFHDLSPLPNLPVPTSFYLSVLLLMLSAGVILPPLLTVLQIKHMNTSRSLHLLLLFAWAALPREQGSQSKVQVSGLMPSHHRHFSDQLLKKHHSHVLSFYYAWSVFMELPRWHWNPPVNAGDMRLGFTLWVGISPGEGNGNPLQYCCLENPMDKGAWWAPWGHKELDTTEYMEHIRLHSTYHYQTNLHSVCVYVCVCI